MQFGGLRTKGIHKQSVNGTPLITVITVVYNSESTLEYTILSIINQTYKNIEYIIIDGASTDNTIDIIKKYEDQIDYWISEPDEGIYYAMNKGIALATGEWINFMNSGDIFYTDNICQDLKDGNILSIKESIVYGDRLIKINDKLIMQKSCLNSLRYCMGLFHQSCFVSSILHKNHPFLTRYRIASDYDFFYRMLNKKIKFIRINSILCIFLGKGYSADIDLQFGEVLDIIKRNNIYFFDKIICGFLCCCQSCYLAHFIYKYFPFIYKVLHIIYHKIKLSILVFRNN
jgi:glycosyltransferase involved in cell wall biosynthesis